MSRRTGVLSAERVELVNLADDEGCTPLHAACSSPNADEIAIATLLSAGASPNLRNSKGQTAYDLAMQHNAPSAVLLLLNEAGAEGMDEETFAMCQLLTDIVHNTDAAYVRKEDVDENEEVLGPNENIEEADPDATEEDSGEEVEDVTDTDSYASEESLSEDESVGEQSNSAGQQTKNTPKTPPRPTKDFILALESAYEGEPEKLKSMFARNEKAVTRCWLNMSLKIKAGRLRPLTFAVRTSSLSLVELFLAHGAKADRNELLQNAIDAFTPQPILASLLKAKADPNEKNSIALVTACQRGDAPLARLLLEHGAHSTKAAIVASKNLADQSLVRLLHREMHNADVRRRKEESEQRQRRDDEMEQRWQVEEQRRRQLEQEREEDEKRRAEQALADTVQSLFRVGLKRAELESAIDAGDLQLLKKLISDLAKDLPDDDEVLKRARNVRAVIEREKREVAATERAQRKASEKTAKQAAAAQARRQEEEARVATEKALAQSWEATAARAREEALQREAEEKKREKLARKQQEKERLKQEAAEKAAAAREQAQVNEAVRISLLPSTESEPKAASAYGNKTFGKRGIKIITKEPIAVYPATPLHAPAESPSSALEYPNDQGTAGRASERGSGRSSRTRQSPHPVDSVAPTPVSPPHAPDSNAPEPPRPALEPGVEKTIGIASTDGTGSVAPHHEPPSSPDAPALKIAPPAADESSAAAPARTSAKQAVSLNLPRKQPEAGVGARDVAAISDADSGEKPARTTSAQPEPAPPAPTTRAGGRNGRGGGSHRCSADVSSGRGRGAGGGRGGRAVRIPQHRAAAVRRSLFSSESLEPPDAPAPKITPPAADESSAAAPAHTSAKQAVSLDLPARQPEAGVGAPLLELPPPPEMCPIAAASAFASVSPFPDADTCRAKLAPLELAPLGLQQLLPPSASLQQSPELPAPVEAPAPALLPGFSQTPPSPLTLPTQAPQELPALRSPTSVVAVPVAAESPTSIMLGTALTPTPPPPPMLSSAPASRSPSPAAEALATVAPVASAAPAPAPRAPPHGLQNLGNTCFLNAALQPLLATALLRGFLSEPPAANEGHTTSAVRPRLAPTPSTHLSTHAHRRLSPSPSAMLAAARARPPRRLARGADAAVRPGGRAQRAGEELPELRVARAAPRLARGAAAAARRDEGGGGGAAARPRARRTA